jgi:ribosomal-protein-serine acetyltransferase
MIRDLGGGAALRPLAMTDADELHALVEANRDHLAPWMPWAGQDRAGTRDFLDAAVVQEATGDGAQYAITRNGAIAGTIGLHRVDWRNASVSLGYWLARDAQGHGLVTRAVELLLGQAFAVLGLNRVDIRAAPDNARSRAVPERLGFVEEGTLREAERHADRFSDLVVYALLAAEWRARAR